MAPWSWFQSKSQQPEPEPQPQPQKPQQEQQQRQQTTAPSTNSSSSASSSSATPPPPVKVVTYSERNDGNRPMPEPHELRQVAAKALQTGMVTGGFGVIAGAGLGVVRSAPPTILALFAGLQWFALGSSYMASRELLYHAWGGEENLTSSDFVKAGGVAGAVSGMAGGMLRGPRNVLPGMLFFGTVGAGSSYVSQRVRGSESEPKKSLWDSKWSPMQRLSDKDYISRIEEQVLRLDAEIAIVDEKIASLKTSASQSSGNPTTK